MSTTSSVLVTAAVPTTAGERTNRHRRISPQAGHALEILGHAIDYLTDEFACQAASFSADTDQLEAIQMLMALNRQIYFECPVLPSFGDRCRAWFHLDAN